MNKITYEERKAIYYNAIAKYGTEHQMIVALEEMSELQKEICKDMRGNLNLKNLIEEIADVTIMLEQLRLIIGENGAVCEVMDSKIERLAARINSKGENKNA